MGVGCRAWHRALVENPPPSRMTIGLTGTSRTLARKVKPTVNGINPA